MSAQDDAAPLNTPGRPNGSGAAAILSAGIGCFALAALAILGDTTALFKSIFAFYKPTGPLSGITTVAILAWIVTWLALERRWRNKTVAAGRICAFAVALLILGLILTFPPVGDLF